MPYGKCFMTPADHFLTGSLLAAGMISVKECKRDAVPERSEHLNSLVLVFLAGVAGAFADIDFFWSDYGSADPVTGHRGMTHSIPWSVVQGLLFAQIFSLLYKKNKLFVSFIFIIASLSHVWLDSITPGGVWEGLPVWFPFSSQRFGAWAFTGWVDFRLTLILLGTSLVVFGLFLLLILRKHSGSFYRTIAALSFVLILCVSGFCIYMILHSQYENSTQWMSLQKEQIRSVSPGLWSFVESAFQFALRLFRAARAA